MRWLLSCLFCLGILLAGGDGPWFPWPNLAGLALLMCFVILAGRVPQGDLT